MSENQFKRSYNERLFGSGLRKLIHESRYLWVRKKLKNKNIQTVLELGCFDGKLLEYLPDKPKHYDGFDANWENGLDLARQKWSGHANFHFSESNNVEQFNPPLEAYDLTVSMETLEHVPDQDVPDYISVLSKNTSNICLITVPNEIGFFLLLKTVYKKLKGTDTESYTGKELVHGLFGNVKRIKRNPGGHKGFSHKLLLKQIRKNFEIEEVVGLPFGWLSSRLNPTVGIVASKQNK